MISKRYISLLICLMLALLGTPPGISSELNISSPLYIAHAGGGLNRQTYTNSLQALDCNYKKGFRYFEIDFSWTADGELVAIHDWGQSFRKNFYIPKGMHVPTMPQFLGLEHKNGLTQLSMKDIFDWAARKGDVFIVTDVKENNIDALRKLKIDLPEYQKHVIPQVYSYNEYKKALEIGYTDIILTLYRMNIKIHEVLKFAEVHKPFAITMHWKVAQSGLAYYLSRENVPVYAHTVNEMNHFKSLEKVGVFRIYTDFLAPL